MILLLSRIFALLKRSKGMALDIFVLLKTSQVEEKRVLCQRTECSNLFATL